jgi:hypothetical protein
MPSQAAVRTFLFVGLGFLALGSASAFPIIPSLSPPVVSWGPNRLDFFVVGEDDGHLWHTSFNGVAWQTAWDDRGSPEPGRMPGAVSVVSWGPNRLDVFMGGGAYQDVWHTAWNGSFWQPWDNRGRPGSSAATSLSAVSWGPNRLDVFTLDAGSGHLWQLTWNGSTWVPWTDRGAPGGVKLFFPTAVSWGPYRIDVFAGQQFNGTVWHTAWNGSFWQSWDSRGAPPNGGSTTPSVVSWGPGRLDLFMLSTLTPHFVDDNCWHDSWNGSAWETAWDARGGPPAGFQFYLKAVSWGPNRLDVFGLGLDGHVWHNSWDGYAWEAAWDDRGSPQGRGGYEVFVASWGYQRLDVFTFGPNGHVWDSAWDGSRWLPWADLGSPPENIAF